MFTAKYILELLLQLEHCIADELEDQYLDFKQWDKSMDKAVKMVVHMAICMANGGGGTVVFGVADKITGRQNAILGIPPEIDPNLLKKAVYDQTDPKITPVFESLSVPEGTGRLLLMHITPGIRPYTDTAGKGAIRIGNECKPLTGTMRAKIAVETGETDYTAEAVVPFDQQLLSATAMESLRNQAAREHAPQDLLKLSDAELLNNLYLLKKGKLTRAGLLLAGAEHAIREYLPGYRWTFLQMLSDLDYGIREDKVCALPLSVQRLEELLVPFNPITTYKLGFFHYEYRTWPEIALREALMNAFCHADLRLGNPIMVKLYPNRLEISNSGAFIAGITPENILHHPPAARNLLLVEALTKLRLVNRSSLGISRMYSALLVDGKEPPVIREIGDSVLVSFPKRDFNADFRLFVADEDNRGNDLSVDELLLLQYLLLHPEIDITTAATLCQRDDREIREHLSVMVTKGYLEQGGARRGTYWCISPALYNRLTHNGKAETRRRIDWETAKTRILSILSERCKRDEEGLNNQEIRQITHYDRNQAYRLMKELRQENPAIQITGRARNIRYKLEK